MKKINTLFVCAALFLGLTAKSLPPQPHLERQGSNLVTNNPDIDGSTSWALGNSTVYDSTVSQDSGTGSLKLTIPYDQANHSYINSGLIAVSPGTVYTLAYNMRSDTFPCPIPNLYVAYYDSNKIYIRNSSPTRQSVTVANSWEECVYNFRPITGEVYIRIKSTLIHFPKNYTGIIWLDNFYLGTGIGFEQAPTEKKSFEGSQTRVDKLGNVEIKKNGVWTPFFPISIYSDGTRPDWSDYSDQGFNTVARTSVSSSIQKAKDAGMMSNFDFTGYVMSTHSYYNNLTLLESRLDDIETADLMDSLLFYYWDNEIYDEWTVPISVTDKIRELDEDANGDLRHPIYALQGNESIARRYNNSQVEMTDIVGTYMSFRGDSNIILNNIEGQCNPFVMTQINNGAGMTFRPRLFTAIAQGAKGIATWRDTYYAQGETVDPVLPPVEDQPWWDDLPNMSSEIEQMMPLIRMPHWTSWSVSSSVSTINFGTRDFEGRGYIIAANESDTAVTTTFTLTNLPYTATVASDFFTGTVKANISSSQFSVSVPAYGSLVLKLEDELEENTILELPLSETSGTTTADQSHYGNDGTLVGDASLNNGILVLDGTGDYVNCGNNDSLEMGTDDMTIVTRIKMNSTQNYTYIGIVCKGGGSSSNEGYSLLYYEPTGQLKFPVSDGTSRVWLNSNANLNLLDNEWHTVAVTLDRDENAIFYLDGVSVGTANASSMSSADINNSTIDLKIGRNGSNLYLNGNVDNLRIYKKSLLAQEITDLSESVLYLTMDKNEDTAFDCSIYGNDGSLMGDAILDVDMLHLDGTEDYVNCGNNDSLEMGTDDMTIVTRIKMNSTQNYTYIGIVCKGGGSSSNEGYSLLYYEPTGQLKFPVSDGTSRVWLNSNTNLNLLDNEWHTVAVTLDRDENAIFYLDGVSVGTANASSMSSADINNSTIDLKIGRNGSNLYLDGNVDSVRVYKRALTAAEVAVF